MNADGHLDIGEPASTYIEEWVGTDSESVTIRNQNSAEIAAGQNSLERSMFVDLATPIDLGQLHALSDVTMRIRQALSDAGVTGASGAEIDHVEVTAMGTPFGDAVEIMALQKVFGVDGVERVERRRQTERGRQEALPAAGDLTGVGVLHGIVGGGRAATGDRGDQGKGEQGTCDAWLHRGLRGLMGKLTPERRRWRRPRHGP